MKVVGPGRARPHKMIGRVGIVALLALLACGAASVPQLRHAHAASGKVLILDSTVTNGANSLEAQAAQALGYTVDDVTDATWSSMSTAQFASYAAIVIGDPTCDPAYLQASSFAAAAVATTATWGPAISGSVIIIGTDPVYHAPAQPGAATLIQNGIAFAASNPGKTGAYIDLSCAYSYGAGSATYPVPLLDAFSVGGFSVHGVNCGTAVHITATSPALSGLTDSSLSNWSCSDHEAFQTFPPSFSVLAIALDGGSYVAPDGTNGTPYLLARGSTLTVISDIKLYPSTSVNPLNFTRFFTATVQENSKPRPGATVTFSVVSGPNAGKTATGLSNAAGIAAFAYSSTVPGVDFVTAKFTDDAGKTQTSNTAQVTWMPRATLSVKPSVALPYVVQLAISGTNFLAGEPILLFLDKLSTPVAALTAAADGTISTTIAAPFTTFGAHTYIALGRTSFQTAAASITIIPGVYLTVNSLPPGMATFAIGAGFGASEQVQLHWDSPTGTLLGTATTDANGSFLGSAGISIKFPAGSTPGTHTIYSVGQTSHATAYANVNVQ